MSSRETDKRGHFCQSLFRRRTEDGVTASGVDSDASSGPQLQAQPSKKKGFLHSVNTARLPFSLQTTDHALGLGRRRAMFL